jgi:hypothetical protein
MLASFVQIAVHIFNQNAAFDEALVRLEERALGAPDFGWVPTEVFTGSLPTDGHVIFSAYMLAQFDSIWNERRTQAWQNAPFF